MLRTTQIFWSNNRFQRAFRKCLKNTLKCAFECKWIFCLTNVDQKTPNKSLNKPKFSWISRKKGKNLTEKIYFFAILPVFCHFLPSGVVPARVHTLRQRDTHSKIKEIFVKISNRRRRSFCKNRSSLNPRSTLVGSTIKKLSPIVCVQEKPTLRKSQNCINHILKKQYSFKQTLKLSLLPTHYDRVTFTIKRCNLKVTLTKYFKNPTIRQKST